VIDDSERRGGRLAACFYDVPVAGAGKLRLGRRRIVVGERRPMALSSSHLGVPAVRLKRSGKARH
jgi:hypothetical protein